MSIILTHDEAVLAAVIVRKWRLSPEGLENHPRVDDLQIMLDSEDKGGPDYCRTYEAVTALQKDRTDLR